jgi:uncharacterized protein (DUF488 family)
MSLLANLLESEPHRKFVSQRIYTTGFEGKDFRHLPGLLKSLEAVLIDIRFTIADTPIQWRKDYLKLLLRDKYLHVSHLGDRSGGEPDRRFIHNLNLGIKIVTEMKTNVLLMCECREKEDCHRKEITEKLKEQGIEAEEIIEWQIKA